MDIFCCGFGLHDRLNFKRKVKFAHFSDVDPRLNKKAPLTVLESFLAQKLLAFVHIACHMKLLFFHNEIHLSDCIQSAQILTNSLMACAPGST